MLRQLIVAALLTLSTSSASTSLIDECVSTIYESCNPSGFIPTTWLEVEIKVKPNSCLGDCHFTKYEYHKGYSIDTYSHGRVWVQHGNYIEKIKVPKNHKLISCYCKQDECIIVAPSEIQYALGQNPNIINKGGNFHLRVKSTNLMD